MNFAAGTQAGMASGSGRPCPCEPQVHLAPVVDLIILSLESITIHRYSHTVAGMQLLALLHYIELQLRNSRPIHVTVVNPCLCMASAYDLSCVLKFVLKFVKIFVLKFFFGCAQAWSLNVIQTGTIRKPGCSFLFAFHSNYGRIFKHL